MRNNFSKTDSLVELRRKIQLSWDAVPDDFLLELVHSIWESRLPQY